MRYQWLKSEIERQFQTATDRLRFGTHEFDFTRVADPESVLDEETLAAPHDELPWQPYWAETWDSAAGVCEVLAARPLTDCRTLDLGCGLGMTGCVAAAAGAVLTMADFAPPSLLFAELNTWPWRRRVCVRRTNWCTDKLGEQFQLIVGSDILYDREDLPHLDRFWREHLTEDGVVLLGEPNRAMTTEFLEWLEGNRWHISQTEVQTASSDRTVRVFELICV